MGWEVYEAGRVGHVGQGVKLRVRNGLFFQGGRENSLSQSLKRKREREGGYDGGNTGPYSRSLRNRPLEKVGVQLKTIDLSGSCVPPIVFVLYFDFKIKGSVSGLPWKGAIKDSVQQTENSPMYTHRLGVLMRKGCITPGGYRVNKNLEVLVDTVNPN